MLRVEHRRVARRDAKKRRIEFVDVVQVAARLDIGGVAQKLGPLAGGKQLLLGEDTNGFTTLANVLPVRRHVGCAGETSRHADNRDGGCFAACRASVLHC